jgi:hypothetical protein
MGRAAADEGMVLITVADTGPGVAEAMHRRCRKWVKRDGLPVFATRRLFPRYSP